MSADPSVSKEAKEKFYNEVYKPSFDRYQQALVDYLKAHASQDASVCLLSNISGLEKKKEAFMLLDASVREGRMRPLYDNMVAEEEEALQAEAQEKEAMKKQAE